MGALTLLGLTRHRAESRIRESSGIERSTSTMSSAQAARSMSTTCFSTGRSVGSPLPS